MKRSEMVQKLIDAVYMCSSNDTILDGEEAEALLKYIEAAGMMPPKVYQGDWLTHDEYEWESEDE